MPISYGLWSSSLWPAAACHGENGALRWLYISINSMSARVAICLYQECQVAMVVLKFSFSGHSPTPWQISACLPWPMDPILNNLVLWGSGICQALQKAWEICPGGLCLPRMSRLGWCSVWMRKARKGQPASQSSLPVHLSPVWGTCSILGLIVAFRWKCLLHLNDQGKHLARSQSLTEIGNKRTPQQDSSADSSYTRPPGGYPGSFCWGSFSRVNWPVLPGIRLYSLCCQ